jgi:hypothetical protein
MGTRGATGLQASDCSGGVGHAMHSDVVRSVFAPLNDLLQEGTALQGWRRLAFLGDVIENIGSFAFPSKSEQDVSVRSNAVDVALART